MSDRTCAHPSCTYRLVSAWRWRRLSRFERWQHRQQGFNEYAGRGLCRRCHHQAGSDGTLQDYPRATMSRDEVLTEWEHLNLRHDLSRKRRIEIAAPRMGMTPAALERALLRAQKEAS